MKRALLIIFLVLLADQVLKIYIKTHYALNERTEVFSWFHIHFIENRGMAFGAELGGWVGKLLLTLFRLVMVGAIIWYLRKIIKRQEKPLFIASISLILAGAIGNIIDSMFYGLLFGPSNELQVAEFMPKDGGYESFLFGNVVDMLSFPMIEGHFPSWFPFWGGEDFLFFRPIFNLADSAITVGVCILIIKQRSFFGKKDAAIPVESIKDHTADEAKPDLLRSGHGQEEENKPV
jgi:signal peptidase II